VPQYTITAVSDQVRDWNTKKGDPWKSYRVTLRNERGDEKPNVEVSRAASDDAPKVNEVVDGTVENREQYGPKLNTPRRGGGGGGWKPKPPEERRSIAMQHAQKCAVTILEVAAAHGDYKPPSAHDVANHATVIAGFLFSQVIDAEKGATRPPSLPPAAQSSDVPSDFPHDPKPEANKATEDVPF
jgi:hypothetical protein